MGHALYKLSGGSWTTALLIVAGVLFVVWLLHRFEQKARTSRADFNRGAIIGTDKSESMTTEKAFRSEERVSMFDPLYVHIRKRLPSDAHLGFKAIERYAAMRLDGFSKIQNTQGTNFVCALWAANQVKCGTIQVQPKDLNFIFRAAETAMSWMSAECQERVMLVIQELTDKGLIVSFQS